MAAIPDRRGRRARVTVTAEEPGEVVEEVFVAELKRKALTGSALVALRGAIVALLALVSTVLLTRNLSATDFGIASLGISLATGAAIVSEVGLGAGLIRRVEPPLPVELRAVAGAQLLAAIALFAVVSLVGLPFGRIGMVTASMIVCLPLLAFRTPGMITLERELKYSQVARIEVGEALVYRRGAGPDPPGGGWGLGGRTGRQPPLRLGGSPDGGDRPAGSCLALV